MLEELNDKNIFILCMRLKGLSDKDKFLFSPHSFELGDIRSLLLENGNKYYLFYHDNCFVGYGMIRNFNKYVVPTLGCVIWSEYRSHGMGKKIMLELISEAENLGYKHIMAKVHKNNLSALRINKSVGFTILGEKNGYIIIRKSLSRMEFL